MKKPYQSGLVIVSSDAEGASLLSYDLVRPLTQGYRDLGLADPVFSPDGRYILFKRGYMSFFPYWQLYVLDTQTQQLTQVRHTQMINYDIVSWSPDSKYLCFILAGDNTGNPKIL